MVPALLNCLRAKGISRVPEKPILLIICPLNSLIDSHVRELRQRGFGASVMKNKDDDENIMNGNSTFVFCNPESVINNQKWRDVIASPCYQENLVGFVTDEVHCIPKW